MSEEFAACEWHETPTDIHLQPVADRRRNLPEASDLPTASAAGENGASQGAAVTFADLTTLQVGGTIRHLVRAHSEAEIIDTIQQADAEGLPLLVLGGGSNIVGPAGDFPGVVLLDERSGINIPTDLESACGGVTLRAVAGQSWDELVCTAIEHGAMGVEALSGIPGVVGAAPVQNIGAYGQEVAETLASVTVWDRQAGRRRMLAVSELQLGYRTSVLKSSRFDPEFRSTLQPSAFLPYHDGNLPYSEYPGGPLPAGLEQGVLPTGRYVVLEVELQMRHATLSRPVAYAQLAELLGVELGDRVPSTRLREAVLELRRSKGMVLDDTDRDTFSCGSFFTNPVLTAEQAASLPAEAPRFEVADHTRISDIGAAAPKVEGLVKTSAAWLIDHAGFGKGWAVPGSSGAAALSSRHVQALTNRGGAQAADIHALCEAISTEVHDQFGILLEPEPVIL